MANQKTSALSSSNFWIGLATLAAAAFSYFGVSPDLAAAGSLGEAAQQAADAISTRNWVLLFSVAINVGNILYHLFWKRS